MAFLNRAFGGGILTGASCILLLLSYVMLLSVYAQAFGSYGASLAPAATQDLWRHGLISAVIVALVGLNVFAAPLALRSENLFNLANVRHASETGSRAGISALAAPCTAAALVVLCVAVEENPATRRHPWILIGMIGASLAIEIVYRRISRGRIQVISSGAKDRS